MSSKLAATCRSNLAVGGSGATSEQPAAEAAVAARLVATAHGVASARRQRAKTLVELDRLAALGEGEWRHEPAGPAPPAGRLLRIEGPAMRTSGQAEVITGPCRLDECVPLFMR